MMRNVVQADNAFDDVARDEDDQDGAGQGKSEAFSFKRLKDNVAANTVKASADTDREEERGPRFVLRIGVSQPQRSLRDFHSERTTGAKEINAFLFQVKGRTLQPCCYVDTEYDAERHRVGEGDKLWYTFPANNRVKLKPEKTATPYSSVSSALLRPGHYVLAVYQEDYMEDLDYCLRLDTFEDPALPAKYNLTVEEIGSCAKPLIEIETTPASTAEL